MMVTLLLIMMFRLHTAGLLFRRWYQLFMGAGGGGVGGVNSFTIVDASAL